MRTRGAQATIAVVCLVLGIMIAIQFKTTTTYNEQYPQERVEVLAEKLKSVTSERDAMAEEVLSLRSQLNNVRENNQATADLQDELQRNSLFAGLLPVKGAGVIITVNDIPRNMQNGDNPNSFIVHDQDLLFLVNELKASGAEAISINGERITAMSEIRCAGTMILVNTNRIAPPFVMKAVGNPDMLVSGMELQGGWLGTMRLLGYPIHVQKSSKIEMDAYNGKIKFTYVTPVEHTEKAER